MAYRRDPKKISDPATRAFYETVRCPTCGDEVRVLSLDIHQRSHRCAYERTVVEMRARDWNILGLEVPTRYIERTFHDAGIDWEEGLIGISRMDEAEIGFWAPTWACIVIAALQGFAGYQDTVSVLVRVKNDPELQAAVGSAYMLVGEGDDPYDAVRRVLYGKKVG